MQQEADLPQTPDAATEDGETKTARLRSAWRGAKDGVADKLAAVRDRSSDLAGAATESVESHPYVTAGIAFALGMLVGMVCARQREYGIGDAARQLREGWLGRMMHR